MRWFRDDVEDSADSEDWVTQTGPLSPFTPSRQIVTISPTSYNDAQLVGETYRGGGPVVVHLGTLDDAVAKRIVDFCAGLVFGDRGSLERISAKVFLLTPPGLDVSEEARAQVAADRFLRE
jgi:cell division inhibitor SepF